MAERENKSLQNCEYCGQSTRGKKVEKRVVGEKHIFCCELCWALFRYKYPKEKIWLEWS